MKKTFHNLFKLPFTKNLARFNTVQKFHFKRPNQEIIKINTEKITQQVENLVNSQDYFQIFNHIITCHNLGLPNSLSLQTIQKIIIDFQQLMRSEQISLQFINTYLRIIQLLNLKNMNNNQILQQKLESKKIFFVQDQQYIFEILQNFLQSDVKESIYPLVNQISEVFFDQIDELQDEYLIQILFINVLFKKQLMKNNKNTVFEIPNFIKKIEKEIIFRFDKLTSDQILQVSQLYILQDLSKYKNDFLFEAYEEIIITNIDAMNESQLTFLIQNLQFSKTMNEQLYEKLKSNIISKMNQNFSQQFLKSFAILVQKNNFKDKSETLHHIFQQMQLITKRSINNLLSKDKEQFAKLINHPITELTFNLSQELLQVMYQFQYSVFNQTVLTNLIRQNRKMNQINQLSQYIIKNNESLLLKDCLNLLNIMNLNFNQINEQILEQINNSQQQLSLDFYSEVVTNFHELNMILPFDCKIMNELKKLLNERIQESGPNQCLELLQIMSNYSLQDKDFIKLIETISQQIIKKQFYYLPDQRLKAIYSLGQITHLTNNQDLIEYFLKFYSKKSNKFYTQEVGLNNYKRLYYSFEKIQKFQQQIQFGEEQQYIYQKGKLDFEQKEIQFQDSKLRFYIRNTLNSIIQNIEKSNIEEPSHVWVYQIDFKVNLGDKIILIDLHRDDNYYQNTQNLKFNLESKKQMLEKLNYQYERLSIQKWQEAKDKEKLLKKLLKID